MDVDELKQKLLGSGTIGISVGPKPIQWTKFNDHHTVANFENIVGEFKGIDQFLEGIQGQIGLPFGNLARKMELEVASDTQDFDASNNAGHKFSTTREHDFVASDHLAGDFRVPDFRDREQRTEIQSKPRHFVPLKVFLYATCAKPLQVSRRLPAGDTKGYSGKVPQDLKEFVLAVLLRRAREAGLTADGARPG